MKKKNIDAKIKFIIIKSNFESIIYIIVCSFYSLLIRLLLTLAEKSKFSRGPNYSYVWILNIFGEDKNYFRKSIKNRAWNLWTGSVLGSVLFKIWVPLRF
jgi:hypothetical protein